MVSPELRTGLEQNQERRGPIENWLQIIEAESLLPPINKDLIKTSAEVALAHGIPLKFILTLCPAFRNLPNSEQIKAGGPTREIVPFDEKQIPRLHLFAREIASLVVGTKRILGVSPQILLIINDIFEPGVEKRVADIDQAPAILNEAKSTLHRLFQAVDSENPEIWPFKFQSSVRIVLQSDFIEKLTRFGLPAHDLFVSTLMRETLDPQRPASAHWLKFLQNTRNDPIMSPNAWLTTSGALSLHERVRFLVAMYWTDGLVDPLLFKSIFRPDPQKRGWESKVAPIFICGVTRDLQAEMEMAGVNFHLDDSQVNNFAQVQERGLLQPKPAIHIIRNTATWTEPAIAPFTFGRKVILK